MKTISSRARGFTLIELLVVISIIALLSSIMLAALGQARTRAQQAVRASDFTELQQALELYHDKHGAYPAELNTPDTSDTHSPGWHSDVNGLTDFSDTLQELIDDGYISEIPDDPTWPNNTNDYYIYYTSSPASVTSLPENGSYYYSCGDIPLGAYALVLSDSHPDSVVGMQPMILHDSSGVHDTGYFCKTI